MNFPFRLLSAALLSFSLSAASIGSSAVASGVGEPSQAFHGNCFEFRGRLWNVTGRGSRLIGLWWQALQKDYSSNYPPQRTQGPDAGPTPKQFAMASKDMSHIRYLLHHSNLYGLMDDVIYVEAAFGVRASDTGPYEYAAQSVFNTLDSLYRASGHEMKKAGSGIWWYHQSQREMVWAWDAMKQLRCQRASNKPQPPASHKKPNPPPPSNILLKVSGNGIKTTPWFNAPSEWKVDWSYDCSGFGTKGNFQIYVFAGPQSIIDVAANALDNSGSGVQYEHQGGRFYLEMNSECDWWVTARRS